MTVLVVLVGCSAPDKKPDPQPQKSPLAAPGPAPARPAPPPRTASPPGDDKAIELSFRSLYVSGSLDKKDVDVALRTAFDQLGDCDGRLSDWRDVVRGSVSIRVARTGAISRVRIPRTIDGALGECVRGVLEPMIFPKQKRRTRISFRLEVMPTTLSEEEIAVLDKCDDVYRICVTSLYSYTVPKPDLLEALLEVHLGGPCNRAKRKERYSVSLRFNEDGTFKKVRVRVRSGRKETRACLENELSRAQIDGKVTRKNASASLTLSFEPASTAPFDAAPAHIRLGLVKREGSYSRSVARSYLRRKMPELRECYDAAVIADPDLAGTAHVRFNIVEDGASEEVQVRGVDDPLGTCLATQIDALKFLAPPKDAAPVSVEVPLTLVPARRVRR